MNNDSLSCDSFDEENLISRASPKGFEQTHPARSRFSILTDMNEGNTLSKKAEEQSLLSRYMKDLHDEQYQNPIKNMSNQADYRETSNLMNPKDQKGEQTRIKQASQYDWQKKVRIQCPVENAEDMNKTQSYEKSRIMRKQSESYGIFMYKMKIDLNKPIDFSLEQQENIHRNYGQSRNSSKLLIKDRTQEDMLFGKALRQQHHHPKNTRF